MAMSPPMLRWCWRSPPEWRPRQLAELLCKKLAATPDVAAAEIAGPGFINLRLEATIWPKFLASALSLKRQVRPFNTGARARRSTSSMSRPIRPGHCMSVIAVVRSLVMRLASLLAATGYAVSKEYYINDAGAQVDTLARSAFLRYRKHLGEDIGEIPAGLYPGDYLKAVGVGAGRRNSVRSCTICPRANGLNRCGPKPLP